eukprot:6180895-Pleurochrysis_carterae.AAC.2
MEKPAQVYVFLAHSSQARRIMQRRHAVSLSHETQKVLRHALQEDARLMIVVIELGHREICFVLAVADSRENGDEE